MNEQSTKIRTIVKEVLLDYQAQREWTETTDPDFFTAVDVLMRRYDQEAPKEEWFRTGVIIGGVYERWKQKQESAG